MKANTYMVFIVLFAIFASYCNAQNKNKVPNEKQENKMNYEINKSNEEWEKILSPEEFHILRNKGTERPYTGKYNLHFEKGNYYCKGCGNLLFDSDTKFESHCGWPSFYDVENNSAVKEIKDTSHGIIRTEVVCAKCGGHLGHVFDDGPNPTGLRYCINSVSIDFKNSGENKDEQKK